MAAKPISFETKPDQPPLIQATALTLGILGALKTASWAELDWRLPAHIELLPGQMDLLNEHRDVLSLVRAKTDESVLVTVAACPVCARWLLLAGTKTISSKCRLTPRCTGPKLIRASRAPRRKA